MKAILTSSLGGSFKVNGTRVPSILIRKNGLLENLKSMWKPNAKVLIICADPRNYEKNDSVCNCLKQSFPMSGLSVSAVEKCDDRNPDAAAALQNVDVLVLAGGHVPTQNKFMKQIQLKDHLTDYEGILVAWSAGSMNCADMVYAAPELEGEATDPCYERWIPGLGNTNINILPHFQILRDDYLDGMRFIEDITYADSMGHEIFALNDGSYIILDESCRHEGKTVLYGEAYLIKDGKQSQICNDGECLTL